MSDFSPREIVSELDRFIIGQKKSKKGLRYSIKKPVAQTTAFGSA